MAFVKDLNTPLLKLSPDDVWTADDATKGSHVFGGIGSGKTSATGKMYAGAYLRAGMGGLVTAVKPEEISLWQRYCAEHGRSKSLLLFDENEGYNFLTAELGRHGLDGIGTVVECLMRILEAAKRASPTATQKGSEAFWEESTRMLLRYTLLPLYAANGKVSMEDIIRFVSTAPESAQELSNPEWQRHSFMYRTMEAATRKPVVPVARDVMKQNVDYWGERWHKVPEKTRGNIVITIGATLDRFLHGRLKRAFCGETTLVPELSLHGVVILMAMPTLSWNEDGVIAQVLFKYLWQRAVLNRNSLAEKHRERLVFLFSDEAQEVVSSFDGEFLSLCRGSKCCVTYLSQSLPSYIAKIGGDNPRDAATGLIGKFNTHVYHSNACPDTNDYAARMIGKVLTRRGNYSSGNSINRNVGMSSGANQNSGSSHNHTYGSGSAGGSSGSGSNSGDGSNWGANRGRGASDNMSRGYSESMEFLVEPGDFARRLKTGGKANGSRVTGVWFQSGKTFKASGTNVMMETFKQ